MRQSIRDLVESLTKVLPLEGPVYEFGSYQVQPARVSDMRPFFPGLDYFGFDVREGPGVDEVLNAEDTKLPTESAGVIICLDTLEHVARPEHAIGEAWRLLQPGGWLLLTTVMNWPIHNEPSDYWRFTPAGLGKLIEQFDAHSMVAWSGENEFPHTVLAFAWKGEPGDPPDFIEQAREIIREWCRKCRFAP